MEYITPLGEKIKLNGKVESITILPKPDFSLYENHPEMFTRKEIQLYQKALSKPFGVGIRLFSTKYYIESFETKEEQQNWYNHCIETYLKK